MKNKHLNKTIILLISLMLISITLVILSYKKDSTVKNVIKTENKEIITIENNTEKIDIELAEDIDLDEAREKYQNNDIVARLEIPDLFNIIIVHGTDNDFYLNHDLYKKKDNKGTEYLDYRTNTESKQINIYGHNSRTYNIPFRKLEKFLDKDFFENHEYIVLQTYNSKRIYHILSIKEDSGNYEHMKVNKSGSEFKEHIDILKSNSINSRELEYDENANILILQTCSYGKSKTYYVITAVEIENYTT